MEVAHGTCTSCEAVQESSYYLECDPQNNLELMPQDYQLFKLCTTSVPGGVIHTFGNGLGPRWWHHAVPTCTCLWLVLLASNTDWPLVDISLGSAVSDVEADGCSPVGTDYSKLQLPGSECSSRIANGKIT